MGGRFQCWQSSIWGPKLKQVRPQWTVAANLDLVPAPEYRDNLLLVTDYNRQVALDTGSERSLNRSIKIFD